jgi:hypothetical protein
MKNKIILGTLGTMLISSACFAAPVVDIGKGDASLEVTYNKLDVDGLNDKIGTTETNLTYGLTDKYALSVGHTWTEDYQGEDGSITDAKVQYKVTKDFAVFAGYKKWEVANYDQSGAQFGAIYKTKLADKTNAFATAAFGKDIDEYKIGVTYDIAKNTSVELNYKSLTLEKDGAEADAKGVGFGLTYKF